MSQPPPQTLPKSPPKSPPKSLPKPPHDDEEESDADRRRANIISLAVVALLIVGGIWLVNALIDARKAEECMESGRHNCNPIEVPGR
jgi:hypothetical protein